LNTRVINVSDAPPPWNWLANRFADDSTAWYACSGYVKGGPALRLRTPLSRFKAALAARQLLRRHSGRNVLVSHGPRASLYSELIARPVDSLHLAFSFNFTDLPTGTRRALLRRHLKRVDRFVVASSMERDLYADYFEIEAGRIDVLLWSIEPPTGELSKPARFGQGRYICAIGSQARDYATLIESMRMLPNVQLILVASTDSLPSGPIPPNVRVMTHIPLADAMNVLAHCEFMVLPLRGAAVPCGHVTVVSALHMGKAILATDSSGLHDYLIDGRNALLVPDGDSKRLAAQMERLFDEPELRTRLGKEGLAFGRQHCTEDNAVAYFRRFLADNGIDV
jgi:glycosyltransferase involved in cell wall biosynthesis